MHPDAKKYASKIESHLSDLAISIDSQRSAWLIDAEDIDSVEDILINLAQQGTPERQYLRGAMVVGPGDWYENTMLGPLPMRCLDAVSSSGFAIAELLYINVVWRIVILVDVRFFV